MLVSDVEVAMAVAAAVASAMTAETVVGDRSGCFDPRSPIPSQKDVRRAAVKNDIRPHAECERLRAFRPHSKVVEGWNAP